MSNSKSKKKGHVIKESFLPCFIQCFSPIGTSYFLWPERKGDKVENETNKFITNIRNNAR